jgi:hypothetical protein
MLPAQLVRFRASLALLQNRNNLLFAEPASLHSSVLLLRHLASGKLQLKVVQFQQVRSERPNRFLSLIAFVVATTALIVIAHAIVMIRANGGITTWANSCWASLNGTFRKQQAQAR